MKGKYIYGIINSKKQNSGDSLIAYRDLAAIVREAEFKDYETLSKEEVIKELISHQQTIEKIMNESLILPVKFGTILKNEEEVKSVLEKGYFFLRNALRKIEDKIELDLVCFWNAEKAAQMAFQESKKVKNFYKKITSGGKTPRTVVPTSRRGLLVPPAKPLATHGRGEGVEDKIALGKLVADYLASKREKLSDQILKTLKKVTVENCPHVLADVNILLNQAFLVEKENEETFNHALNKLNSKFAELVNFRLVGPLPPYSFATVVIEVLDKKEIESAKKLLKLEGEPGKEKIKQAFDKLAFQLHPDKGGDPLEFSLAAKSYQLLNKYLNQGLVGLYLHKWEQNRL